MAAWKTGIIALVALTCCLSWSSILWAADEKPVDAAAAHAPPPGPALDKGDQAWMLTSSALVLMMTGPGLALFYSGLVRKKNVLGVMMQCLFLMGLMTVIWALYGYSLSFGGSPGESTFSNWIGNGDYVLMKNVQGEFKLVEGKGVVDFPLEGSISRLTHMVYQCMFFIITPALICGAFAERMKFSTMVVFMILWGTFVYCPLCHWVWDCGILAYGKRHASPARSAGFCRRHGRAHQFGHLGLGLRAGDGPAAGLRPRANAAAQPDVHGHRRGAAVGRLVRLQLRQRPERQRPGGQRASWPPTSPPQPERLPGRSSSG